MGDTNFYYFCYKLLPLQKVGKCQSWNKSRLTADHLATVSMACAKETVDSTPHPHVLWTLSGKSLFPEAQVIRRQIAWVLWPELPRTEKLN